MHKTRNGMIMNNFIDLHQEKQQMLALFDKIEAESNQYQQQIEQLEAENSRLRKQGEDGLSTPTSSDLSAEVELLTYQNNELNSLLKITKSRIGELSNVLIDKETQIKELKANNNKRSKFDIGESDQLFEAKMAINEKDKQIRKLQAKLDQYEGDYNNQELLVERDNQIQVLTKTIDKLEKNNIDLIFEAEELRIQLAELSPVNAQSTDEQIVVSKTTELREIDNLLDQIADHELNDETLQLEQRIIDLEQEFEFTSKAKLALKLLLNNGLYRDQFKQQLMHEREIIDSFVGEVNGYFEDEYYLELIVEDKNHFTINPELFE